MIHPFLLPLIAVLTGGAAFADIHTARSCLQADVQAAITTSSDGDTVVIPNGSATWTSGISTGRQIVIKGASTGGVTLTHGAGNACLLALDIGSGHRTVIANLRFMPGTGTGQYLQVGGSGLAPLLHDCYFNVPDFQLDHPVHWWPTGGVIWNTTFECTDSGGAGGGCLQVRSNRPWTTPSTMGALDSNGDQNLYIEDCTFRNVGQCPDVDEAGRVVVRHCQIISSAGTSHGSTGSVGARHTEFYDNVYSYPDNLRNLGNYFWWRAGTGVICDNTVQDIRGQMWGDKAEFLFAVENAKRSGQFGCCTAYPCFHQCGAGHNGTAQIPDPVYFWNNTGTLVVGLNDGWPEDCPGSYTTGDFFKVNRDYFLNTPKPGYVKYAYPHPLRGSEVLAEPFARSAMSRPAVFTVYNIAGRAVGRLKGDWHGEKAFNDRVVSMKNSLPNGLYIIRITGGGYPLTLKRLIVK